MSSSRQQYVVSGVALLALLVAMALSHGFHWIWVQLGWNDPALFGLRELPLTTVLAYGIGAAAAIGVLTFPLTRQLSTEIVEELAKVSWPSREETGHATVVVIVTVLVCSVYLGLFDAVWLWITDLVLGVPVTAPG